jgi:hypothetical protein
MTAPDSAVAVARCSLVRAVTIGSARRASVSVFPDGSVKVTDSRRHGSSEVPVVIPLNLASSAVVNNARCTARLSDASSALSNRVISSCLCSESDFMLHSLKRGGCPTVSLCGAMRAEPPLTHILDAALRSMRF